jgi:NTE family protein
MLGLVLTAGGARGAYQAGVLKRIGEIRALRGRPSPFAIVTGGSAGAINGTMIASRSDDFRMATRRLAELWSDLRVRDVFRSDPLALGAIGARLLRDLLLGGMLGGAGMRSLFDASPLRSFLSHHLALGGIAEAIRNGHLYAVAITATSYHSGRLFTFIQGRPGHPLWTRARRVTLPVVLNLDHVLASAAIPIVFQPVRLRTAAGELYFGDGALRLVNPLSPAIRLGARRVLAIGIRCQQAAADLWRTEVGDASSGPIPGQPPLSQICGVFLNAVFLDHLDADLDHLLRMNELIAAYGRAGVPQHMEDGLPMNEPMRIVTPLVINPSADLAIVAKECAHAMPRLVRYLMDGLGRPDARSADLMSYLLFDSRYTKTLVDIGYRDAAKRVDEIEAFIFGEAYRVIPPTPLARRAARRGRRFSASHLSAVH